MTGRFFGSVCMESFFSFFFWWWWWELGRGKGWKSKLWIERGADNDDYVCIYV